MFRGYCEKSIAKLIGKCGQTSILLLKKKKKTDNSLILPIEEVLYIYPTFYSMLNSMHI